MLLEMTSECWDLGMTFYFHLHLRTDEVIYKTGLCNKCIYIVSYTILNMSTNTVLTNFDNLNE